jgi:hypothetical protein
MGFQIDKLTKTIIQMGTTTTTMEEDNIQTDLI